MIFNKKIKNVADVAVANFAKQIKAGSIINVLPDKENELNGFTLTIREITKSGRVLYTNQNGCERWYGSIGQMYHILKWREYTIK